MTYKLQRFTELMEIVEKAFIHKLKVKNPNITEGEIKEAISEWYLDRPGAPYGDSPGVPGDISKFLK